MDKLKQRLCFLPTLLQRPFFKALLWLWAALSAWDTVLSQLIPVEIGEKFPRVYGLVIMTSGWLPWWVWLLVGAAIITLYSFELAFRKHAPVPAPATPKIKPTKAAFPTAKPPAPKATATATAPMGLKLEYAKFSFSAVHSGSLTDGMLEIKISNCLQIPLQDCTVFIETIEDDDTIHDVQSNLNATAKGFTIRQGASQNFNIARRDLKDVIKNPPWLLKLESGDFSLHDGQNYILTLFLRSQYQFPTKVKLKLSINAGRDVDKAILEQVVDTVAKQEQKAERPALATARLLYNAEENKFSLLEKDGVEFTILPPSMFSSALISFTKSHKFYFSFNSESGPFDIGVQTSITRFEGSFQYETHENKARFVKITGSQPLFHAAAQSHEVTFTFYKRA